MTVQISQIEDVRRVIESGLESLPVHRRRLLSHRLAAQLRDAGLLGESIEQHYRAVDVARLLSRTPEWVVSAVRRGFFGYVSRDDGGWLIPASAVNGYLLRHEFGQAREEAA